MRDAKRVLAIRLDGHRLEGGVDMGRTMDIALRKIDMKYKFKSANFNAAVGGSYNLQEDSWSLNANMRKDIGFADAYARGSYNSDGSWDTSAGIEKSKDNMSWGLEGFAKEDLMGNDDQGVRATFKLRF